MLAKTLCMKCASALVFLLALGACSSGKWNGAKFVGEGTVNGSKPTGEATEAFTLTTRKVKSGDRLFINMDAANHVLGDCSLNVWNRADEREGAFELVYPDTQCDTIVDGKKITVKIYTGDITVAGDEVKLSLMGSAFVPADGATYKIDITGKRKGWF
jgi:hypothetical protein